MPDPQPSPSHAVSSIDVSMMKRAIELAQDAAQNGEVPVGAVVYRDTEVLGEAANLRETLNDPTAHAEMIALRIAAERESSWRLIGCTIAVTLEPCPMCAGAIVNARIGRLVYGAADPKMGCVDSLYRLCGDARFNHRVDVTSGVLGNRCGELLTSFFAARRSAKKF